MTHEMAVRGGFMSRPALAVLPGPTLRVSTIRLVQFGFVADAVVTASAEPGIVTFTLCEDGLENYKELVRLARRDKTKLVQVLRKHRQRIMELTGALVIRAGFQPGDALDLSASTGLIQIRRLLS